MSMWDLITDEHVTLREFLKSFLSTILEFQVAGKAFEPRPVRDAATRPPP
jgi:hypothetical protein